MAGERDHLPLRDLHELGVSPVEISTHPAHQRRRLSADGEGASRRGLDDADGFDSWNPREAPRLGHALPEMQLRPVQAEGHHPDQHFAVMRHRKWD